MLDLQLSGSRPSLSLEGFPCTRARFKPGGAAVSRLELLPPPRGHSLWSRPPQPLQAPVPASQLREPLCSAPSPDGASRHQAGRRGARLPGAQSKRSCFLRPCFLLVYGRNANPAPSPHAGQRQKPLCASRHRRRHLFTHKRDVSP